MSKLYGSIQGCRGAATRCGTSLMKACTVIRRICYYIYVV